MPRDFRVYLEGLRDILIHQYFGVDTEILRDIITSKVPVLERCVSALLEG